MKPMRSSACSPEGVEEDVIPRPTGRSTDLELNREIQVISMSAIVDGLLNAVHGLMAVLNEHRQVLALNDSLLKALGVPNLEQVIGLRLGEAVHCIRAEEAPNGCGTSAYCQNCGAAIAQVIALGGKRSTEQLCAIETSGEAPRNNLFFRVRASPLNIANFKCILLFLQDVSQEQRVAALEQVFLHDLRNTTQGISMCTSLLANTVIGENTEIVRDALHLAERLSREIELHRCLTDSNIRNFQCQFAPLSLATLFEELQRSCRHHPAMTGHSIEFIPAVPTRSIATDLTILHRILYNMIINALEASPSGGTVSITETPDKNLEIFTVWNSGYIPPVIARRIFQRNFTTKRALGHGLGTYSIKLLGEKLLGGRVSFTTSPENGTSFRLELSTG